MTIAMARISPIQLIHEATSRDTIECARTICEKAEAGLIVGLVVGVIYKRRRYSVFASGTALDDPTFSRGVVSAIDDELREIVHDGHEHQPTL